MYVAVDDTDSVKGNCTTFLATEIIRKLIPKIDLIGNPRLVRLNPAVPWKTRGNGSLVMRFGHGKGTKTSIGVLDDRELHCYSEAEEWEPDKEAVLKELIPLVEEFHSEDADPGLFVSYERPSYEFYLRGVTTIMDRKDIDEELERIDASIFTIGNGRGLIGATCGLAWIPGDSTFELLAYREREKWGKPRVFDPLTIRDMEHSYPTTFNSWEDREQKVAMIPATPCPVLYGLRGDVLEDVISASGTLRTENRERWMVFLTNQGTDDHIIEDAKSLIPNQSYLIQGTVTGKAKHIRGGHVFFNIETAYGDITCGIYEPAKEFRLVADQLIAGDKIEVMGELREFPSTLNIEKMHIVSVADEMIKSNPVCQKCGRRMESAGKGQGYRCRKCHTEAATTVITENRRWIVPGWYEPPTAARRHLSKPLKRMNLEQPVEFVNRRTQ